MWDVVSQVGSALTLVAFVVAAGVAIWRRYLLARERQLLTTPESERGVVAQALNDAFLVPSLPVDPNTLSPTQRYNLLLEQIRDRSRRFYAASIVIIVIAIIIGATTILANSRSTPSNAEPKGPPPFRISYLLLEGHAIDFLIDHQIDASWSRDVSGATYIVPNSVFARLHDLRSRFSAPGAHSADILNIQTGQLSLKLPPTVQERQEKSGFLASRSLLALTWGENFSGDIGIVYDLSFDEFKSATTNAIRDANWKPSNRYITDDILDLDLREDDLNLSWEAISAWRYLDGETLRQIIERYRDPTDEGLWGKQLNFLLERSHEWLPPRFVRASFGYSECGETSFYVLLLFPRMRARVAILENITDHNLQIGDFESKSVTISGLSFRRDTQKHMKEERILEERLFPQEILRPGEKLVIPLELYFGDYLWHLRDREDMSGEKPYRLGQEACMDRFSGKSLHIGDEWEGWLDIDTNTFCSFVSRIDETEVQVDKDIVTFGPTMELRSVEIDGSRYPIRKFDPKLLVINGDFSLATGSCPYISTFDPQTRTWASQGTFLTGNNLKELEGVDLKPLREFYGVVRISEQEREITYLDSAFVLSTCSDGEEQLIRSQDPRLRSRDGRYLVLRPGDEVILKFSGEFDAGNCRVKFGGAGYYLPIVGSRQSE